MSLVRPFKALRPKSEFVKEFSCPPYDVLEDSEVKTIVKNNPNSFLRVTRAEVEFENDVDSHSDIVYKKASENLNHFESSGIIFEEDSPSYYIYRETWRGKTQTGIFATVSSKEYDDGLIKKHELTRQDKEDDRTRHISILSAQTGPVFLTYKSNQKTKDIFSSMISKYPKIYEITDQYEVFHEMWRVNEPKDIELIKSEFSKIDALYIADGHHRAAAASRNRKLAMEKNPNHSGKEEYNFFLAAIFPEDELRVLDYNRVVKDLNNLSKEDFFNAISDHFEIKETAELAYSPKNLHEFGMFIENQWYVLKPKKSIIDRNDPVKELDVYILQEYLLSPILNIKDPRKDPRIYFLGGIRGVKALEDWIKEKNWKLAFSMYPTPLEQLINVADASKIMPPKSTWFEPKLRSGLLIHKI